MAKNYSLLMAGLLSLTSCNFYGGIDKPSGDPQILSAARGCFDRGDYVCASEYYAKLSSGMDDTRISETAFVSMARDGVFSVSDLVLSLGSGHGNGGSLTSIANLIAGRGKTAGAYRASLQTLYTNANSISNTSLKAYTQFMISLAMMNQILATGAGADHILSASDMVSNPVTCKTATGGTITTACADPDPSSLVNLLRDTSGSEPANMNATGWEGAPTIVMFIRAAVAANASFSILTNGSTNYQGIINVINTVAALPGGGPASRQLLQSTLF